MKHRALMGIAVFLLLAGSGCATPKTPTQSVDVPDAVASEPQQRGPMTDEEWKKVLTPEQYYILRQKGTERPYSSPLNDEKRAGTYVSADCGVPLFRSEQKYDSGTGWPSFLEPIDPKVVTLVEDNDFFLGTRVEVIDAKCGGHLGHVFDDGPPPTGKRYCMNGDALIFVPDAEQPAKD